MSWCSLSYDARIGTPNLQWHGTQSIMEHVICDLRMRYTQSTAAWYSVNHGTRDMRPAHAVHVWTRPIRPTMHPRVDVIPLDFSV